MNKVWKWVLCCIGGITLQGCADKQQPFVKSSSAPFSKPSDYKLETALQEAEHMVVRDHIFGDSLRIKRKYGFKSGTLTPEIKTFIRNVWKKAKKAGFEGYDPGILDHDIVFDENEFSKNDAEFGKGQWYYDQPFHAKFVYYLICFLGWEQLRKKILHPELSPQKEYNLYKPLVGLTYKGKYLYMFPNGPKKSILLVGMCPTDAFNLSENKPNWNRLEPGEIVDDETLKAWNRMVFEAFLEDPFFKEFLKPTPPADLSCGISTVSARTGTAALNTANLNINGVQGGIMKLSVPIYIQLSGSLNEHHCTPGLTTLASYRQGNTTFGMIHAYANDGTYFARDAGQNETSILLSYSFRSIFIEGQLGWVSTRNIAFQNDSGVRSHLTCGIDTAVGTPFIQAIHRDFETRSDSAAYGGYELTLERHITEAYCLSTQLTVKGGYHSVTGWTGSCEWSSALHLTSGISFENQLSLNTITGTTTKISFNLSR